MPEGHVSDVTGLEGVVQDPAALASVRGWLANISAGARFPKKGIAIGEKWHSEEPVPGAPLRETVWRSDSSYLRNESCRNAIAQAGKIQSIRRMPARRARRRPPVPEDVRRIVRRDFDGVQNSCRPIRKAI